MAAANTGTWQPPKLDLSVDRYVAFQSWYEQWEDWAVVTKLDQESAAFKVSMLRYAFTEETRRIYNTLTLSADDILDHTIIIAKLKEFAKGTVNETMERHTFNSRSQEEGETFDDFLTELRILRKSCNFCEACSDGLLRDRIVGGIRDTALRQKLLSENQLTLKKTEDMCRAKEKAKKGAKMFNERDEVELDEVTHRFGRNRIVNNNQAVRHRSSTRGGRAAAPTSASNRTTSAPAATSRPTRPERACRFCVTFHSWGRRHCPAWDKPCTACGQKNHTKDSRICKKKSIRNVNQQEDEVEVYPDEEVDFLFLDQVDADGSSAGETAESEDMSESSTETTTDSDSFEDMESLIVTLPVETNTDQSVDEDEEYFSCNEVIHKEESKTSKKKKNKKMKRKSKKTNQDEALSSEEEEETRPIQNIKKRRRGKRKKSINQVQESSTGSEEEGEAAVCPLANSDTAKTDISWEIQMPAQKGTIDMKIDTGADVTVMGDEELPKLGLSHKDLRKTKKKLFGPGKKRLRCLGYVRTVFTWGNVKSQQLIYVCKGVKRALLGKPAIRALKIVTLNLPTKYSCAEAKQTLNEVTQNDNPESNSSSPPDLIQKYPLLKEFPQLYNKLGKIEVGGPINIKLKDGTVPHQTYTPRHIPLPLLEKVITELNKMEQLGVIKKIDKPTDWCHPIVIVSKPNGDIRLCIDLTKLNAGVERELYPLESIEETLGKLGDECVFMSKVDANSGYWQVPLSEESQELTTFITPIGRFCCTRGPYGLSSMQEIFGKKMDVVIEGLQGVVKSTDDFMVYGKTKEILQQRTRKLFQRFVDHGVTINLKKCEFEQEEMEFIGHHITKAGIRPIASKMEAITEFPQPTNIKQLRRFMGMANQMAKFNPNLAEASAPLRDLLSTKNHWVWTAAHDKAFADVKDVINSPVTLKLYDVHRPTKLRVDGSKLNGISAILYQKHDENWHPVTCGSRYLTPTEKDYYPIENEMLAVTWGCKKMKMYLLGLPQFTVETDHKPLIPILNTKQITEMSPRIQDMRMKLLPFSFTAQHVPGKDMEDADALSRAPHKQPTREDHIMNEEIACYVNEVVSQMPATTPYLTKIKRETKRDTDLQLLTSVMSTEWPKSRQLCPAPIQAFWDSRHDLTTIDGMIVKGTRIVIPKSMHRDVLQKLHNAHQGMDRTKRRARQSCYWPKMNSQIEKMIKGCTQCLKHRSSKQKEELKPRPVPTRPWEKIGSDLFDLHGSKYIIITDYYSSWPEVYQLKQANSAQVISVMKDTFARHGIPTELVSDNGSQYKSHQFKKFSKEWDFQHETSSPPLSTF